jgi:hypothetical protein
MYRADVMVPPSKQTRVSQRFIGFHIHVSELK